MGDALRSRASSLVAAAVRVMCRGSGPVISRLAHPDPATRNPQRLTHTPCPPRGSASSTPARLRALRASSITPTIEPMNKTG
jgi:hypothetical protein